MAMLAPLLNMTMIGPLPIEVFYLILVLAFVMLLFILFKRPIYETMFLAFCFSVVMTGKYNLFFKHLVFPATQSNLFISLSVFCFGVYLRENKGC